MPKFIYTAKPHPSKTIQGVIEAESEQDAVNKLSKIGYFPIFLKSEGISFKEQDIFRFKRISKKEIAFFTAQASSLIESGINIINTISIIFNQSANKYLKSILSDIISKVKDGKSLSDSLAAFPHVFSSLYSSMVRVGEASGNLKEILKRLADYLESEEEFKNTLRASLVYPFFIFSIGLLTILVLLIFVIPRLVTMFEDMGQSLPLATQIIIGVSGLLRHYWWLIFAICGVFVFSLERLRSNPQGRLYWDKIKLRLAIFGPIILKAQISRLMRTLSLMLSSGMPITPALEISTSILENEVLKVEVQKFKEEITSGASLSHCLKNSQFFPEFTTNIIAIGEETGDLDKSLIRIADDYEKEIDRSLKTLTRLLEPIIILVMGLVVGFIVLSMLLPIFQINLMVR